MKQIYVIIVGVLLSFRVQGQFTQIPTGTTANISEITVHGDTLILLGFPDYFAKYCVTTEGWTVLPEPGISSYASMNLQVVHEYYYVLSRKTNDNYILKSADYGNSWDTLFHTPGKFYTISMADSTFGVLGGFFGCKAITDGSDTAWVLQDSLVFGNVNSSATYGDSTAVLETDNQSYITYNRGLTWELLSSGFGTPRETEFLNKDTIFSLYSNAESAFSMLTYNGSAWISSVTGVNPCTVDVSENYDCYSNVTDMHMNYDGSGYILAHLNSIFMFDTGQEEIIDATCIFYTNDYGNSWTTYVTGIPGFMFCMTFLNDTTAFIGGENGVFLKWDLTVPLNSILEIKEQIEDINEIEIYPNPVQNQINLSNTALKVNQLTIYSVDGREVFNQKIENQNLVDVSDLPAGVYVVKVISDEGIFTVKILKE